MGVDLSAILSRTPCTFSDLSGKVVAIDAFNALYQFLATIRQRDGTPLMDRHGRITSHLSGLFYRTVNMMEAGIRPVYVFDGEPVRLKRAELDARAERRETALREWMDALRKGDMETARSKAQLTSRLTPEMADAAKRLLDLLGAAWMEAPHDGEAQSSYIASRGDAHASASQDYDSLLYGTPRLVRNLTVTGRRKLPRRDVYVDVRPELVSLDEVLMDLGLTREQIVDVGLLVGTDFNPGIKGIGPKRAVKLVREYGSIEKIRIRGRPLGIDGLDDLRSIFLEPEVNRNYTIKFSEPDGVGLTRFLCDGYDFSPARVEAALGNLKRALEKQKQRTLDIF